MTNLYTSKWYKIETKQNIVLFVCAHAVCTDTQIMPYSVGKEPQWSDGEPSLVPAYVVHPLLVSLVAVAPSSLHISPS